MANVRTDSWAAQLGEYQQWALYGKAKKPNTTWTQAVQWAVAEFGLARKPSQASFYRWKRTMRKVEFKTQLKDALVAKAQTVALGNAAATADELVAMLLARMTVAITIDDDIKAAAELLDLARMVQNIAVRQKKYAMQDREAEILSTRADIERTKLKIVKCEAERAVRESEPPEEEKLSPEEREKRILEILGIEPPPPPGEKPAPIRTAEQMASAARHNRRRQRHFDK